MLSEKYNSLYNDYYVDSLTTKRELTAICTMDHIKSLLGNRKFGSVVDVGAGQGALAGMMSQRGFAEEITALEISDSGLERIWSRNLANVKAFKFDGYKSDFPDKAFDLGLSIHVLEHVEHERLYLKELGRISKQAIIEVPLELTANAKKVMALTGPYGHINFYQRESFENILKTMGFHLKGIIVNTVSLDMDVLGDGKLKGTLKNFVRRSALVFNEGLARRHFVYLCTAWVECP